MSEPARNLPATTDRQAIQSTAGGDTKPQREIDKFRGRLEKLAPQMMTVLPKYVTPERVTTLALMAATKTPKLLECTTESTILSLMQLAQSGLELGRTAYLVPFKMKDEMVCTFVPAWQGLVQLMIQSRHIKDVKMRAVYSNEHFVYREGADPILEHSVMWDESKRGDLVAFYAVAFLARGGSTFEVMSKQEVDKIRNAAPSKNSPAWNNHYVEMGKKTVLRRLAKRNPQWSDALNTAVGADAQFESLVATASVFSPDPSPIRQFASNQAARGDDGQMSRLMVSARSDDPYVPEVPAGDAWQLQDADELAQIEDDQPAPPAAAPAGATRERHACERFVMPFGEGTVGKPLGDIPSVDLASARKWAMKNNAGKFAEFITQSEELLELRRLGEAPEPPAVAG